MLYGLENTKNKMMYYRWIVWGILALAYLLVFFHRLAVGVVRSELMDEFNISETTFANLGAMYFYIYLCMQMPSGFLADSIGAKKTVSTGMFLSGIGSLIFGFAPLIEIAFLGRFLVGLGVSVVFVAMMKIQSEWFHEKEFGMMSGLTSVIGSLGGILAQTPLALMVAKFSWRISFGIIGCITLILSLFCIIFIKNSPKDKVFLPLTEQKNKDSDCTENKIGLKRGLFIVLKNNRTWPCFLVFTGFFPPFVILTGVWGRVCMMDVFGLGKINSANYMLAVVLGVSLGSVIIGKVSDYFKNRKIPMIIYGVLNTVCWLIFLFYSIDLQDSRYLILLLFVMGVTFPSFVLCWGCSKEVNPRDIVGISTSVVNTAGFLGAAILPMLIGPIFDKYKNILGSVELYQKAFSLCLVFCFVGLLSIFFIKETNCRNIYNEEIDQI